MSAPWPSWMDGVLHEPGAGRVALDDPGFLAGLALFETLLLAEGVPHFLEQHLARLRAGLAFLGIEGGPAFETRLARAFAAYLPVLERELLARGLRECGLRVVVTRGAPGAGPSLILCAREALLVPSEGVRIVLEPRAKLSGDPLEQVKTTARVRNVLAWERARAAGAFEALLLNERDELCEATSANVFAARGGRVLTPATECGCLAGVTRENLLGILAREGRPAEVGRFSPALLEEAEEVFLSNTTGRLIAVGAIEGLSTRLAGAGGPLFSHLRASLAALEEGYRLARRG